MEGTPEVKEVPLSGMLGHLATMKKLGKWGYLLDCNGNVATFMKYKSSYFDLSEHLAKSEGNYFHANIFNIP